MKGLKADWSFSNTNIFKGKAALEAQTVLVKSQWAELKNHSFSGYVLTVVQCKRQGHKKRKETLT